MRRVLDVWVAGRPATKGSVDVGRHGQILPASRGMGTWAELVRRAAERAVGDPVPPGGAALVTVAYFLPAPDSVRVDGTRDWTQAAVHDRVGDLDKLERCVWDALTRACVWADDVQVWMAQPMKFYAGPDIAPGAHVKVYEAELEMVANWRRVAVEDALRVVQVTGGGSGGYPPGR